MEAKKVSVAMKCNGVIELIFNGLYGYLEWIILYENFLEDLESY